MAEANPVIWRRFAVDLAERLKQRNVDVKPSNERPKVFVICSTEALPTAQPLADTLQQLDHDPVQPLVALCASRSDGRSRMLETWHTHRRMRLWAEALDMRACHPAPSFPVTVWDAEVFTPHSPSPESGRNVQRALIVGKAADMSSLATFHSTSLANRAWCSL